MKDYVLVSDSTADLPIEVVKQYNIEIVPFTYSINDEVFGYYLSEKDGDISDFYSRLKRGAMPVTSQINPVTYKDFFESFTSKGKAVLYMCFSSGLSGSYQTAKLGVDMLKEEDETAEVTVIDTFSASVGQGIFVYEAAMRKAAGMEMDELAAWVKENRHKVRHWFMVEDLFHLKRGGRVSTVEAMVGSALKIKPILSVDEEGRLVVKSKTRGENKALDYLLGKVVEEGGDLSELKAVIGHADALEKAVKLKKLAIEAGMKDEHLLIAPIGPIIGTHVGAGMTAIAFVAE